MAGVGKQRHEVGEQGQEVGGQRCEVGERWHDAGEQGHEAGGQRHGFAEQRQGVAELAREARLWAAKWRWYERASLPWNRARLHWHFMRREAFLRWPVHGNVLEALEQGRLSIGAHTLFEPGVWITAPGAARVTIGQGVFLNLGVMIASAELVEIGDHCMLANGCFISDASHRYDDPDTPVPWQGFESKGPTRIGDNCWLGAHVVVTSGVSIGRRCVIGANSVVTKDVEPYTIAAGVPARPIGRVPQAAGEGTSGA